MQYLATLRKKYGGVPEDVKIDPKPLTTHKDPLKDPELMYIRPSTPKKKRFTTNEESGVKPFKSDLNFNYSPYLKDIPEIKGPTILPNNALIDSGSPKNPKLQIEGG